MDTETLEVPVTVPKETYELTIGLGKFAKAVKESLDDGFQPGQDLPVMITEAVTSLIPALNGAQNIGAEYKSNPIVFYTACGLLATQLIDLFD